MAPGDRKLVAVTGLAQVGVLVFGILAGGAMHRWAPAVAILHGHLRAYGWLYLAVPILWTVVAIALLSRESPGALGRIGVIVAGWALVLVPGLFVVIRLVVPFGHGEI